MSEAATPPEAPSPAISDLAEAIVNARSVVVLTGAGVSVPSGIPDFRTPETGMWANVDPMEVAHIDTFQRDPERFWSFYGERFASLGDKRPNGAHDVLAELERRGLIDAVITQNIDRLHHMAGTEKLIEVHGSIEFSSCLACGEEYELDWVRERAQQDGIPTCTSCEAAPPLKPNVVLFGEMLPEAALQEAFNLAAKADLLLAIGSSLVVHPVAGLPTITLRRGGQLALVTSGPTPYDEDAFVKLEGDVERELTALLAAIDDLDS
ncbi:MAG: NAD-dependent protein deacylase [Actinobacteria bacterium]|nr:NAD-dependent protein deacylase [Actinomycetota bacterium]